MFSKTYSLLSLKSIFLIFTAIILLTSCESISFIAPDSSGLFKKFFGGALNESGSSVVETPEGHFLLIGSTNSTDNSSTNIFLTKTDENGNRIWEKQIEKDFDQNGMDLEVLPNGDALLLGYTTDIDGNEDYYLLRVDTEGNEVASFTYGEPTINERGIDIIPSISGGFLLVGLSGDDMYIVKTDDKGAMIFSQTYGIIEQQDNLGSIIETDDENLVWCGTTSRVDGLQSMRVVSTDPFGSIIWDFSYETLLPKAQSTGNYIQKASGGYIITGKAFDTEENSDILLVKINENGTFRWASDLSLPNIQYGNSVAQTTDGGFIITGINVISADNSDIYLVKTNSRGVLQWDSNFGGQHLDEGNQVHETQNLGLIILGTVQISNNKVTALIKTDALGNTVGDRNE